MKFLLPTLCLAVSTSVFLAKPLYAHEKQWGWGRYKQPHRYYDEPCDRDIHIHHHYDYDRGRPYYWKEEKVRYLPWPQRRYGFGFWWDGIRSLDNRGYAPGIGSDSYHNRADNRGWDRY